ncbi:hypothetical protein AA11825_1690 [Acetobacter pomorum DSM 11825]|nr:hypothetical protein AA11825_1690 [Acetobacter pomorum DSM 11825]
MRDVLRGPVVAILRAPVYAGFEALVLAAKAVSPIQDEASARLEQESITLRTGKHIGRTDIGARKPNGNDADENWKRRDIHSPSALPCETFLRADVRLAKETDLILEEERIS